MKKNKNLRLSRALKFRIQTDGKIYGQLSNSSGEFYIAPEVFAILVYFSNLENSLECSSGLDPSGARDTIEAALKALPQFLKKYFQNTLKNIPDQKQCKEIIADLLASGFLLEDKKNADRTMQNDGFGDPWIQWAMISDVQRSSSYEKALGQKITKDSVVLDIGSGTGFLSACALSHGAKKVYAVEESNISKHIKPILKDLNLISKNNLIKNFILHANNTYDVDFPDDINLAVSELFGNDPFQEGMFLTLCDVVNRIQNKKIEFIPKKLVVYGEFINILNHPTKPRIQLYQNNSAVESIKDSKVDSKIKSAHTKTSNPPFYTKFLSTIKSILPFESISFPIHLTENDFERVSSVACLGECSLNPIKTDEMEFAKCFTGEKSIHIKQKTIYPSEMNLQQGASERRVYKAVGGTQATSNDAAASFPMGIDAGIFIFWFRTFLTDTISISSHPQEADYACHWSPIAIVLNKKINSGSKLKVEYNLSANNISLECQIFENKHLIGARL